jgi:hypothetical protein
MSTQMPSEMVRLLTGCLGYRALVARTQQLGRPLSPDEARAVEGVERAFAPRPADERPYAPLFLRRLEQRFRVALAIEFLDGKGIPSQGVVRNVSLGGLFVATPAPCRPGERIALRFHDEQCAVVWQFAAEVAWARIGEEPGMGLAFVGMPVEIRVNHQTARPVSLDAAA